MTENIKNYLFLTGGIVVVTGHRPPKIFPFQIPNPIYNVIGLKIQEILLKIKPKKVISGMALGIDQLFAKIAIKNNIPLDAYLPMKGQEKVWPEESQQVYHRILARAQNIIVCSNQAYSSILMQVRNCQMVDQLKNDNDYLLACWDGSKGGTGNCVGYAELQGKNIIRINPSELNK